MQPSRTGDKKSADKVKEANVQKGDGYAYYLKLMGTPRIVLQLRNEKQYLDIQKKIKGTPQRLIIEDGIIGENGDLIPDPINIKFDAYDYVTTAKLYHGSIIMPSGLVDSGGSPIKQ
jgi:hypothetical protein